MNILMYVEPFIEKSISHYRRYSLLNFLVPYAKIIKENQKKKVNIKIVTSDAVLTSLDGLNAEIPQSIELAILSQNELKQIFPNYKVAANKIYNDSYTPEELSKYKNLLNDKLNNFEPDVIICYESLTNHLRKIYKNALVLDNYFGVFSRIPFPVIKNFDPCGINKTAFATKFKNELNNFEISSEQKSFVQNIRDTYFGKILQDIDPVESLILPYKAKFDKLILLPMQGANYHAFEENCTSLNLYDFVQDFMSEIDESIGVVVSEHTAREVVINDANRGYLEKKHKNFIHIPELSDIKHYSQFLMRHVDSVAYISSSVGLMGSLLQKPVFQVGKFEGFASSGNNIKEIAAFLKENNIVDRDNAFYHLFSHQYFQEKHYFNGEYLYNFLEKSLKKFRDNNCEINFDFFEPLENDSQTIFTGINNTAREKEFIKNNIAQYNKYNKNNQLLDFIKRPDIKIVSFDVFDNLVIRPFHIPNMLFAYMEIDIRKELKNPYFPFYNFRISAEKEARKIKSEKFNMKDAEVTFDEIYEKLQEISGLDEDYLKEIKQREIDLELELLYPRSTVKEAYQLAKSLGKQIIITSDIYFSNEIMEKILLKNGYTGYSKLFISSEYTDRKKDGSLFTKIINELECNPKEILHLGDNYQSDVVKARELGLNAHHTYNPRESLLNTRSGKIWDNIKRNPYNSIYLGLVANKFFVQSQKPDFESDSIFDGSAYNMGYYGLGLWSFEFAKWVLKTAVDGNYKKIYFLAREGKIIKRAYDIIKNYYPNPEKLPEVEYLLCSRRSAVVPSIFNEDDILEVIKPSILNCTIAHMFENRLGVNPDKINDDLVREAGFRNKNQIFDQYSDAKKIKKLISLTKDIIIESAAEERKAYVKYLNSIGFNKSELQNNKAAVVDIGYSGTMQLRLSRIIDHPVDGFYMVTRDCVDRVRESGADFKSYLIHQQMKEDDFAISFNNFGSVFETVFSCEDGSLVRFNQNNDIITPEFIYSKNEQKRVEIIKEIDSGILDFISDITKIFKDKVFEFNYKKEFVTETIYNCLKKPSLKDTGILQNIVFEDATAQMRTKFMMPTKNHLADEKLVEKQNALIKYSIWRPAAVLLIETELKRRKKQAAKKLAKLKEKQELELKEKLLKEKKLKKKEKQKNKVENKVENNQVIFEIKPTVSNKKNFSVKKLKKLILKPKKFFKDSQISFLNKK